MTYINETTNGIGRPIQDGAPTVKFYVRTPVGKTGPYASRAIAEAMILGQPLEVQPTCQITEELGDGRQMLLG